MDHSETVRKAGALADGAFQLLWHEDKPEEAIALYRQAIALLEPLGEDENAYEIRRMLIDWHEMLQYALGDMEDSAGEAAQSEAALRLARRLTNSRKDQACLGDRLQDYAGMLVRQGAQEQALGLWREALALWEALAKANPDMPFCRECAGNASECCRKAADILAERGERSEAIERYLQSADLYEKAMCMGETDRKPDRSLGQIQAETARALEKLAAWQDAAALFRKALEHLQNANYPADRWELPGLCRQLSHALEKSGCSEEAAEYAEKARAFQAENEKQADELRRQTADVRAREESGKLLENQGNVAEALRIYGRAIANCKRLMQCLPGKGGRLKCARMGMEIAENALRLLQKTPGDDKEEEKEKEENAEAKEWLQKQYFYFSRELSRLNENA